MKNILALFLLFYSTISQSAVANFSSSDGKVEILAIGNPSALKIKGNGKGPEGSVIFSNNELKGSLTFDLTSLDTGIKLRNDHMKTKYLQVENFPKAELQITKIDFTGIDTSKDFELKNAKFEGLLKLHGVEKQVNGITILNKKDLNLTINAEFKINIKDFAIEIPSFAGITVTEEVAITVNSKATVQP